MLHFNGGGKTALTDLNKQNILSKIIYPFNVLSSEMKKKN